VLSHVRTRSTRGLYARVYPAAIAHNLAQLRATLTGQAAPRIWATVKADAYGHGIERVLPGLLGADGLAVLHLDEAEICRSAGWRGPVMVYGGLFAAAETRRLDQPGLHLVISHHAQLDWLAQAGPGSYPPTVWLRFAGDMHHIGFNADDYRAAYSIAIALAARNCIKDVGHLNHYAQADKADGIAAAAAAFRAVIKDLPGLVSTCNSATVLRHGANALATDWIRPGLMLYGVSPLSDQSAASLQLRPAMSLHSQIVGVQSVPAGTQVGYSGAFVTPTAMLMGLVACGYADGYPRHATTGTPVLVNGVRTRLLGRVSMDMMAVDLDPVPRAGISTPVTLWGTAELPVEEVASAAGTIAAELLTGLTARVPIETISVSHSSPPKTAMAPLTKPMPFVLPTNGVPPPL
jgi:alanine racemase